MRNEQADVADGAADRNGQAGEDGSGDVDDELDAIDIDAQMTGFLFAGEDEIQVGGSGVDRADGDDEQEKRASASRRGRRGEIAHQPEGHAAQVAAAEGGHEKHDDGGKKGGGDDSGEKQRGAIELAAATAQEVNGGDGGGGSDECAGLDRARRVRRDDQAENGAESRSAGYAENVGVGERVAEQGLKAGTGGGKRGADENSEGDARQAQAEDDQPELGGNLFTAAQGAVEKREHDIGTEMG